jgi:hypothetical protein
VFLECKNNFLNLQVTKVGVEKGGAEGYQAESQVNTFYWTLERIIQKNQNEIGLTCKISII